MGSLMTLGDSIASEAQARGEALDLNETWPFVTTHDFEVKGAHARLDSATELVLFAPIVADKDRVRWEKYSVDHQDWLMKSKEQVLQTSTWFGNEFNDAIGVADMPGMISSTQSIDAGDSTSTTGIASQIYRAEADDSTSQESHPFYAPVWQTSPPPRDPSLLNLDLFSNPVFKRVINNIMESGGRPGLSEFVDASLLSILYKGLFTDPEHWRLHNQLHGDGDLTSHSANDHPHILMAVPVRRTINTGAIVGFVAAVVPWDLYLSRLLPQGIDGMYVVAENTCGQVLTYEINGPVSVYLGKGDLHQKRYDYLKQSYTVSEDVLTAPNANQTADSFQCGKIDGADHEYYCTNQLSHLPRLFFLEYTMNMYPSTKFHSMYSSSRAEIFAAVLAAVFLATGTVFYVYVQYVQRRQNKVMATALRTNAIVSSLFPSNVRDRILKDAEEQVEREMNTKSSFVNAKHRLKNFLEDEPEDSHKNADLFSTKPIADLFPETTLMIADMVGFTAWSSVREPSQVFVLLETVYHAFDQIAKRRGVFKVETVGDCYVAVAGLPEPRPDHAVAMARFAHDCNVKLHRLVKQLEVTLGPDTGDLSMRFGLHSGPVTAGVLRGERSRFQLFGDTVNTTARIETTGEQGRIHISQDTADLIIAAGKEHWVQKREEKVVAKGKGELQTYWLDMRASMSRTGSCYSRSSGSDFDSQLEQLMGSDGIPTSLKESACSSYPQLAVIDEKTSRLIDWNVDLLLRSLRQNVARRQALCQKKLSKRHRLTFAPGTTIIDEVKETITLPRFDAEAARHESRPEDIVLGAAVESELHDYVTAIAMLYRENPFHNFEHASHVTMSVVKLLSRIVAPSDINVNADDDKNSSTRALNVASTLHDHTYGITSDPLTQFACIFSALIHDVDHVGVPNTQLIKENANVAALYRGKSVAEQNSVDVAWSLLMDERFENLQRTIYESDAEFKRFRELVVNSVMATDIMDKDLKALRNNRWEKAFNEAPGDENLEDAINRKATIVIEHLIQASDVSHTMQHWHIYRKWNARLFEELYKAYVEGRAEKDPSEFWYQGEIGFFDFYIIPLAKKLKDCGVFGVSSYEYLNYAEQNRAEWEAKGQELVETMMESVKRSKRGPLVAALGSRFLIEGQKGDDGDSSRSPPPL
jgi:class 3 adenylate cyclase